MHFEFERLPFNAGCVSKPKARVVDLFIPGPEIRYVHLTGRVTQRILVDVEPASANRRQRRNVYDRVVAQAQ